MKQCEKCGCYLDSAEFCDCTEETKKTEKSTKKYICRVYKKKHEIEVTEIETGEKSIITKSHVQLLQRQNPISIEKIASKLEIRIKEVKKDKKGIATICLYGTTNLML